MESNDLPRVVHDYQNHLLDSTRWQHYSARDDDIIVATSIKSGTTWMQSIICQLIFQGQPTPPANPISPWLEWCIDPIEDVIAKLDAQDHRRFIKTHLPLDGLLFHPHIKYIVVGRSPLDVFMSLWNHYSNFTTSHTKEFFQRINRLPGRAGDHLPADLQDDIHKFWRNWITRGWFEWEQEGYPYWSNMRHTQTWWDYRHLDNLLFVHFNDLLANLEWEIRRIASFIDIEVSVESMTNIAHAVSFSTMKQKANAMESQTRLNMVFREGANTFFYKGNNGRWKEVLSEEELDMYKHTKSQVLTIECAEWLEQGNVALL